MDRYRSGRGVAIAIVILVAPQLLKAAIETVFCAIALSSGGAVHSLMGGNLDFADFLVFLATWIVFAVWVYRATANLPALGTLNMRFRPSAAGWGVIIPFLNIVRSYQVMQNIWIESQPAVLDERGVPVRRRATRVTVWYVAVVLNAVLGCLTTGEAGGPEEAIMRANADLVENVAWLVAGALFISLVWGAQKRQDEQWLDLERRRAVPQPNADALR